MRFGIVVFPGTWSDGDCHHAITEAMGQQADYLWHRDTDLSPYDCVVLPGGFSYGDYLRTGAIARFSPVMGAVEEFARGGGLVIGICNGFQILCEAGLLPGALIRNSHLQFRCRWTDLRVESTASPFSQACEARQVLRIPISHGEGSYYTDPATLREAERQGSGAVPLLRPFGSGGRRRQPQRLGGEHRRDSSIAERNVLGMMPHPERCCEPLLGGTDGRFIFQSVVRYLT